MALSETFQQVVCAAAQSPQKGRALRKLAMQLLSDLPGYDWCGIYVLEGENLILDEYVGAPTDHTMIPIGVGVCGTAVAEDRNQVIEDVRTLSNYLSCSVSTRSEIVVLIRDSSGRALGQIDIDSHMVGTFGQEDELMLQELGEVIAERWSD